MNIIEAGNIILNYEYWEDKCCTCHCGNPPCAKCENCPSKEDYQKATYYVKEWEEYPETI